MSVRLSQEEIDEFLAGGHTLILATLRKSGEPFLTPLWYVYDDGALFIRTPARSAKVQHIRTDPRVCCLVEEGERWVDLKAVVMNCDAEFIESDESVEERFAQLMNEKYKAFRPQLKKAPTATKKHYAGKSALIRLTPRETEVRSCYNRKIRGMENID